MKRVVKNSEIDFSKWISELKSKIHLKRNKMIFSLNSQLIEIYWELGKDIYGKQLSAKWGSSFIDKTVEELRKEFPEIKGFSRRNIYAIVQWYKFYSSKYEIVPHGVAQLPWGHNRLIISKIKNIKEAEFYLSISALNGWDRDTLEIQIDNNFYAKSGKSINNFRKRLPLKQSKAAEQSLKDPYNFDFLGLENDALEKAIEDELTKNITKFLLELGKGFAFIGRQYKIEISDNDYFIDMLFYHAQLHCYVVIELKAGKFKPEYAGKLNFYLSAVDSQIKKKGDNPSIGILLCKQKDKIEAEYALRDINKPMGISEYKLTNTIPKNIKTSLPSVKTIEAELARKEILKLK